MKDSQYEVRVHLHKITQFIDEKSELAKVHGGDVWQVWAFMPAFPVFWCSPQKLTLSLHLGTVCRSQMEIQKHLLDAEEEVYEAWWEKLDELNNEADRDTPEVEHFDMSSALANSFDDTYNSSGERAWDYDDLEAAVADYEANGDDARVDKIYREVEEVLKQVREYYSGNDLTQAVRLAHEALGNVL